MYRYILCFDTDSHTITIMQQYITVTSVFTSIALHLTLNIRQKYNLIVQCTRQNAAKFKHA